ncbi:hypothetical protein MKK69_10010 [Methylobacterium sp. J-026]|uniref:hypothetical protein n=1 Tax=Methylobacterium sp. J-026 TaxID=2836624 RepID=UPI001FBB0C7E|nr:hypothetical protein [Methylobacterium sp. J-026]MCJ2134383.1 hypothetical protein [Methylobacterium sp. J-026]
MALPRSTEPGQLLRPGLGAAAGTGVDPAAQLDASMRERAAWAPLRAGAVDRPALVAARKGSRSGSGDAADPNGMVSTPPAAEARPGSQARNASATMDRLEREGQQTAKPICGGC